MSSTNTHGMIPRFDFRAVALRDPAGLNFAILHTCSTIRSAGVLPPVPFRLQ
jgi:hypothetical protein